MDTSFNPTLESSIKELMKDMPPPVRAMFASGKVETVAKSLMTKNQLRVDQAAIVEREVIFLLLGLKNPAEFTQTLAAEANLSQPTINNISQDLNDQIFKPIREQMRGAAAAKPPQPQPARPSPQAAQGPAGAMAPPPQSPKYFHLENKIPAPSSQALRGGPRPATPAAPQSQPSRPLASARTAPLPPKNILPRPAEASGVGGPRPAEASGLGGPTAASVSTPAGARSPLQNALAAAMKTPPPKAAESAPEPKLLEDHEEPHIEFHTAPPPPNLPGAMPPKPVPPPPAPKSRLVPPPLPPKPTPPAPKAYSSDPYREPIEP